MSSSNQQTLVELGATDRPLILEKRNYIPWEIRFHIFLENKGEDEERMWYSITKGPYVRPMITDPDDPDNEIPEPLSKMTEANKTRHSTDVRVMNYLLQAIPNDIYNSVDACKDSQKMWERIRRLVYGYEVTKHVTHSRLMNEFENFEAKEGESLESMYERLSTLVNIMDRNDVLPIKVSINTKFLNSLQPEWSKYVTLNQWLSSMMRYMTPYYNLSHIRLRTSSNTRNQAVIHDGWVDIQTNNVGYGGNDNKNAKKQNRNQAANAGNGKVQQVDETNQIVERVLRTESNPGKANYFREQMLLAMKDEAGGTLNDEENDFMLDYAYGDETLEEVTAAVIMMAHIQPANDKTETEPKYDAEAISEVIIQRETQLAKKAFKARENSYLENIVDLNDKLSSHDRIVYEIAGLGYQNPERLKKAIAAQPKMYDGERLPSTKLIIDSPNSEETLEDAKESRLKIKNKMIQLKYAKLNAFYETFVPQKEFSFEQTYFSTPSTSNVSYGSSKEISDLPTPKMPNESKLLKMFDKIDEAILALRKNLDVTLLKDERRIYIDDGQNTLRQLYKINVIPMSLSLIKRSKELKQELTEEVQEMLNIFESMEKKKNENLMLEKKKISSDFKDIQANLLKRINILKNDLKQSQAQSIDFELKLQHQKEKMACDNSYFRVKRALFTFFVAAKSRNLGATSVVTKSRFSVAKTSTTTNKVIQLVLWIVDSGRSKHMTGNLQLLRNFVEKFKGTICFGNDHFATITGYRDYVQGNLTICHVHYVEGLGHNLFLIRQFFDGDLRVAFRSNTCYVQNLEGEDLLTDSRNSNLYTISISELAASSPVCLMSKATSTKSWL
ncbi:hypothetical protein Tco_1237796 [Tanacetum coccineum]